MGDLSGKPLPLLHCKRDLPAERGLCKERDQVPRGLFRRPRFVHKPCGVKRRRSGLHAKAETGHMDPTMQRSGLDNTFGSRE